jgi:primosomal protein N' (replication factor Y)
MEGIMSEVFVEVFLDQNLNRPLDYRVPQELIDQIKVGMRVEVPLKSTLKKGTIGKIKTTSEWPECKTITKLLAVQTKMGEKEIQLAEWMAKYYVSSLQKVLKLFVPINIRKEVKQKTHVFLSPAKTHDECLKTIAELRIKYPKQADALEAILNVPKGVYLKDLDVSKAVIDSLVKKKLILTKHITDDDDLLLEEEFFPSAPKKLNEEQKLCLEKVVETLKTGSFATHLIYGVTGSGKTEVYMQAIQHTLDLGKSAIMLVPEVSLTSQTIERFRARFSEKIAILHHKRSLGERTTAWEELKKGNLKLVIGARSALFAPAQNLGLIIVDEEHDSSYKQTDEMPCYHGRDTAVMRAYFEKCTILLGSATPSIESRYNAQIGKYQFHELKTRATSAPMPSVKIVDMKQVYERTGGFTHFCEDLLSGLKKRLEAGEQTLLFLNKRGYHRLQLCSSCRYIIKCPHCDLSLTYHKEANFLQCHLCDYRQHSPRECPNCQSDGSLQFKGFGTEHVERSLHALFPEIRTLRMDRDTTTKKNSHEDLFKQFRAHKADVLIGTQMVAKGFHFPSVTLVGVLNVDSLNIPDFRAPEQTFQLLTQVAGRAGRAELPGEVIIQTYLPDHPILKMAANQDYPNFYAEAIQERQMFNYPPFCHLVKLTFTDKDESTAKKEAETAYEKLKSTVPLSVELLPVIAAGHAKVKDTYRFQFLIKTPRLSLITDLLKAIPTKIDVDPLSTFF